MALEPVIQRFGIEADAFLAGIDAMLERVDKLAESISAVTATAERMSGVFDATAAADDRFAAAEAAAQERADALMGSLDTMAGTLDKVALASQRTAAAAGEMAAGFDRAGESATVAGDEAETSGGKAAAFGGAWKTALLGVGIAAVYGIDQAAKFQGSMEQLHTQAGVAQSKIAGLSQGVLQLSGQVGEGPQSLAESLYHVASNMASLGASGPQMMSAVKIAAEGAQVGGANLVDVTNALTAAIASGIPGVQNYQQAMGMLNAAVGSGDMHMQDLADAFSSGLLATVKGYGISLKDVSAALATFGDNNIRGAKAGTDLRMAIESLAVQGPSAKSQMDALGLSANTLADDMKSGGLMKALNDLTGRFKKAGITAKDQGEVITSLFGKKAGSGIAVLLEQMDRLKSKYPDIQKSADNFAGDWQSRQKTMSQQWNDLKSAAQALAISFGTILLPAATKLIGKLAEFGTFLEKHPAVAAFAGAVLALAAGFKIAATMEGLFTAATEVDPIFLALTAVIALAAGLYELYRHSKLVRDIVADIGKFFRSAWSDAMHGADVVIKWFVTGPLAFIKAQLAVFAQFWSQHGAQVERIARAVWSLVRDIIVTYWRLIYDGEIKPGLVLLEAAWRVAWGLIRDTVRLVWDTVAAIIRTGVRVILDIISLALDLLTGKWGAAWRDLRKLVSDAVSGIGSILTTFTSGALRLLWDAGVNIVKGLIDGVKSMFGSVGNVLGDLGHGIVGAFKSVMSIFSPSRVFYGLGTMITKGLALGISETASEARDAAAKLASDVRKAYLAGQITNSEEDSLLSRVGTGLASALRTLAARQDARNYSALGASITAKIGAGITETMPQALAAAKKLMLSVARELSKGQVSTSQAQELIQKIQQDLTSRQDRIVKVMQRIGLKMTAGLVQSMENSTSAAQAKAAVNKLITYVQQAWSAGAVSLSQATGMTKALEADSAKLQVLAARRAGIAKTIATAQAYATTTTTNAQQWAGLGSVAGSMTSGAAMYSGNLLAGMQANLGQIRSFETALKKLARLGLRRDLISQIIQMGPAQGLQVAEALIQGPASVISQMDATQHQLAVATGALGKAAANVEYDTAKTAGKGFLSGLKAQEGELSSMMSRAAKVWTATVKQELGSGVGGRSSPPNVTVHVSGFIGSESQLVDEIYKMVQQESLRHARRNGLNNGLGL